MINVHASAPGKIVLCGEYVVLEGAPAMGLALDRRANVTITAAEKKSRMHVVQCPGFAKQRLTFTVDDDFQFVWRDGLQPDIELLRCVWESTEFRPSSGLSLCLDTQALVDAESGAKLGIGSSAALVVALSAAIRRIQGGEVETTDMINVHRRFQKANGSGIDIATANFGGLIEFHGDDVSATRSHSWPDALQYAVLWSGTPASTASKVSSFDSAATNGTSRARLAAASSGIVSDWSQLDAQEIVNRFTDYAEVLLAFSTDHGLGIFDAGHDLLLDDAAGHAVAYKPCGAGGGDVGIALSANSVAINDFVKAAINRGFHLIDCRIDEPGLRIDDRST